MVESYQEPVNEENKDSSQDPASEKTEPSRRDFLKYLGIGIGTATLGAFGLRNRDEASSIDAEAELKQETQRLRYVKMLEQINYLKYANPEKYPGARLAYFEDLPIETLEERVNEALSEDEIESLSSIVAINEVFEERNIGIKLSFEDTSISGLDVKPEIPPKEALMVTILQLSSLPKTFYTELIDTLPEDQDKAQLFFAQKILSDDTNYYGVATDYQVCIRTNLLSELVFNDSKTYIKSIAYTLPEEMAHLKMRHEANTNQRQRFDQILGLQYYIDQDGLQITDQSGSRQVLWDMFLERNNSQTENMQSTTSQTNYFRDLSPNMYAESLVDWIEDQNHPLFDPRKSDMKFQYMLRNLAESHEGMMRNLAVFGPEMIRELAEVVTISNFNRFVEHFSNYQELFEISNSSELLTKCESLVMASNNLENNQSLFSEAQVILDMAEDPMWSELLHIVVDSRGDAPVISNDEFRERLLGLTTSVGEALVEHLYTQWGFDLSEIDSSDETGFCSKSVIERFNLDDPNWTADLPANITDELIELAQKVGE